MKEFEITDDNRPYLDARGKIVLNACPGSGKTSAIAFKLKRLAEECLNKHGTFAGIACLSFTNVAKAEIATKFHSLHGKQFDFPHVVMTLDSFINQFVTLPFYYLLNKQAKRPVILDVVSFLDQMTVGRYFAKSRQPLAKILKPSKLKYELDGTISWGGHQPNFATVDPAIFDEYAKTYKKWQTQNGYLNNDDSTYIAYRLLLKYPRIATALIERFPYIIVDEAQDTSEIQYKIFDLLLNAGLSNIEYVGDPYQSLYEFREARPDLFVDRFNDTANWRPLRLKDCRRTSQEIIDGYSIFRSSSETAITSTCKHSSDHRIKVLRYDPANLDDLISRYESLIDSAKENTILVRGSTHLEMFGAKPTAEEPWKNSAALTLINARKNFDLGNIKAAVDGMRTFLAEIQLPDADHRTRSEHLESLKSDRDLNLKLFNFLQQIPSHNMGLQNWTNMTTGLILKDLNIQVDFELKQKGKAFYALNLLQTLFPARETKFPVTTVHKVKGMTFHSVMLVLSENSTAANISLAEFVKPTGLPTEKQRMIYVALSRPQVLACIAVPNSISEAVITARLGANIDFV